jgi:hypothetical protein
VVSDASRKVRRLQLTMTLKALDTSTSDSASPPLAHRRLPTKAAFCQVERYPRLLKPGKLRHYLQLLRYIGCCQSYHLLDTFQTHRLIHAGMPQGGHTPQCLPGREYGTANLSNSNTVHIV